MSKALQLYVQYHRLSVVQAFSALAKKDAQDKSQAATHGARMVNNAVDSTGNWLESANSAHSADNRQVSRRTITHSNHAVFCGASNPSLFYHLLLIHVSTH